MTQYSGDPRTEWHLNNFTTKEQLLEAVRNFRYKGGNTFTGKHMVVQPTLPGQRGYHVNQRNVLQVRRCSTSWRRT